MIIVDARRRKEGHLELVRQVIRRVRLQVAEALIRQEMRAGYQIEPLHGGYKVYSGEGEYLGSVVIQ